MGIRRARVATSLRAAVGLVAALGLPGCMTLGAAVAVPAAILVAPGPAMPEGADPPGTRDRPRELGARPRVALALGSGSMRGWAHAGVLAALETGGIRPSLVVGTSAGSVVGALAATGIPAGRLVEATRELDWTVLAELPLPRRGLVRGERLESFVRRHAGAGPIESLPIAFAAVATDAHTGEAVVLDHGDLARAVRASSSVPVLFEPVPARGRLLVDGALSSPTPVSVARRLGADVVIAVNVAWTPEEGDLRNPVDMLFQSMQLMTHNLNRAELAAADVVIAPDLRAVGPVTPANLDALVEAGRRAGLEALPAIRAAIDGPARGGNLARAREP